MKGGTRPHSPSRRSYREAPQTEDNEIGPYHLRSYLPCSTKLQIWLAQRSSPHPRKPYTEQVLLKTAHLNRELSQHDHLLEKLQPFLSLRHRSLASLYEAGVSDNMFYVSMEHVLGRDLGQVLGGRCWQHKTSYWPSRAVPLDLSLFIALEVCDGLAYSASRGLGAHGDLCPWHVMVGFGGEVKILNYGLTPIFASLKADGINESWAIFRYKSPEQLSGELGDSRSDLFTLALILYELLGGQPWVEGDADSGLLDGHQSRELPRARLHNLEAPRQVKRLLAQALSPHRDERFSSPKEMGQALRQVILRERLTPSTKSLSRYMWRIFQRSAI